MLFYSMKILAEVNSLTNVGQDQFDNQRFLGFPVKSPPLPCMLSSMLQSRPQPKLTPEQDDDGSDVYVVPPLVVPFP